MDLDRLAVDLRPRSSWEAVDLGFRLARSLYLPMLLASVAVTLPLFVVLQLLFWSWPLVAILIPWWMKPIWERCHLHILSRALFGERPSVGETIRSLRETAGIEWLQWLTIRRLSLTRSMDLPVTQLEQQRGVDRTKRVAVLRRGPFANAAIWLTIVCMHVEGLLPLVALSLFALLLPETVEWSPLTWVFDFGSTDRGSDLAWALLAYGSSLLVAPFYVAGGFSLYVHRRSLLEGWDLEIAFKRLAGRLRDGLRAVAVLLVLIGLPLGLARNGWADDAQTQPVSQTAEEEIAMARSDIEAVLDGEAFHAMEEIQVPRFIEECRFDRDERETSEPPAWLVLLIELLAGSLEVVLVTLAVILVGYLMWRAGLIDRPAALVPSRTHRRPAALLGLDVRSESLPDDVAATVRELWGLGRARDALALLYRATLSRLVEVYGVELHESDTEAECVIAAERRLDAERADRFAELTRTWQMMAYGHRLPTDEQIDRLCRAWREHFEGAPDAPLPPTNAGEPAHA